MSGFDIAKLYDKEFRKDLVANKDKYFTDCEAVIIKNTKDTIHVVMANPSVEINVSGIQAAGAAFTAGQLANVFDIGTLVNFFVYKTLIDNGVITYP